MAITCPYCRRSIQFKGVKPGRFAPKCPQCGKAFSLTISADDPPKMTATPLVAPGVKQPVAGKAAEPPKKGATAKAKDGQAAAQQKPPPKPKAPPRPPEDQTGAWDSNSGADVTGAWQTEDSDAQTGSASGENATGVWDDSENEATKKSVQSDSDATPAPGRHAATKAGKGRKGKAEDVDIPDRLGGYEIVKPLGKGGMGAVYLARQLSLDRNVAVKVMNPQWADDPVFVARFTREAYAAAQLVHHNVVQIHDIGCDDDIHFFSMEYVKGKSLGELLKAEGKLAPEVAVGYILQAARGLKFAHDRGMIHRDVKPDNLMLNDLGIVKVADLGLVKTPAAVAEEKALAEGLPEKLKGSANITRAQVAVGTPSYMAPEQARSASTVDQRADIYSLGCTLYVLVTGRQPFSGKTIMEVLSKHASEPIVPPETIVKRVPKTLSTIIIRMMAKKPDERFSDLGEVIEALEEWLGVRSTGPFTPKEEHADQLEANLAKFNSSTLGKFKPLFFMGLTALCVVMIFVCALAGLPVVAAGFLGLPFLTMIAYFVISGIFGKTYLFSKVREFVLDSNWTDWLMWSVGALVVLLMLFVFKLLFVGLAFCLLAAGLGFAVYFLIDRGLAEQRGAPVKEVQTMLRNLRLHGLDEDSLRQFVCKYSGDNWEPFYEAQFGYEAKIKARELWGRGTENRQRPRHGVWRDWIVAWTDARMKLRRESRERKLLRQIELKNLKAQGVSDADAKKQASDAAGAMVERAAEFRAAGASPEAMQRFKNLLSAAEKPEQEKKSAGAKAATEFLNLAFGARLRLVLGLLLVVLCVLWISQNDFSPWERLREVVGNAIDAQDPSELQMLGDVLDPMNAPKQTKPLAIPVVPQELLTALCNSYNIGIAGLFLIVSGAFRGIKPTFFMLPAVGLIIFGPLVPYASFLPLDQVPGLTPVLLSLAAGSVLGLIGLVLSIRSQ